VSELKMLANRIAGELIADLNAGKLAKVGIEEIEAACAREKVKDREALIEMATRCLVERI
jgi:hypothetical protein